MSSISEALRDDPVGSLIVALVVALLALITATMILDHTPGYEDWRDYIVPSRVPPPPAAWKASATDDDVLHVDGYQIAYWGRTDRPYGRRATAMRQPFRAIVFHYTEARPALNFIRYQHEGDDARGGSFGYHFYCDKRGRAFQGAPLTMRTNHIKPTGHRQRKAAGRYLSSSNSIGIGMVGGCWRDRHKRRPITASCDAERLTPAQKACGLTIAHALQKRYGLAPDQVFGHGELQNDRSDFEGATLTTAMRAEAETKTGQAERPAGLMSLGGRR